MVLRSRRLTLALTTGALLGFAGLQAANAELIDNNLTISSKAGYVGNDLGVVHPPDGIGTYYEVLAVPAGGTADVSLELLDNNLNGCAATSGSPLTMTVTRSAAAPATIDDLINGLRTNLGNPSITYAPAGSLATSAATVTFTSCGVSQNLTVSAPAGVNYATRFVFTSADARCATGSTCALTGRFVTVSVPSNGPPVVDAGSALTADEGGIASASGTVSDPDLDPLTIAWSAAGDPGNDAGASCTFANPNSAVTTVGCTDDGTWTLTLTASDGIHDPVTDTTTLTVGNVAPTVATAAYGATSASCPADGQQSNATLAGTYTDPALNDTHTAEVDWNYDGVTFDVDESAAVSGGTFSLGHLYSTAGLYNAAVRVTDDDGATSNILESSNDFKVLYTMTGLLSPFNADGTSVWKYGSTVPVKVRITDCAGAPVPGLTVRVGTSLLNTNNPTIGIDEAASTSAADTGTVMRYDASAGQYIYNLNTKGSILTPDGSASYWMYVRQADSAGRSPTGVVTEGQSWQKFGLRLK